MTRVVLAVVAAGMVAGAAGAEPIRFGYSTSGGGRYEKSYPYENGRGGFETASAEVHLDPFSERTFQSPGTELYYDRRDGTEYTGARFRAFDRGDWGGGATHRDYLSPPAVPVTLTIRDFASNETADIPLSYALYYSDSAGDHLYLNAADSQVVGRATMGGSVYEFRADWDDEYGMFVTVSPATAVATPEPTTVLLAGLGLAGVFARRVAAARCILD